MWALQEALMHWSRVLEKELHGFKVLSLIQINSKQAFDCSLRNITIIKSTLYKANGSNGRPSCEDLLDASVQGQPAGRFANTPESLECKRIFICIYVCICILIRFCICIFASEQGQADLLGRLANTQPPERPACDTFNVVFIWNAKIYCLLSVIQG